MAAPRVVLDTNTVVMPLTRKSNDDWIREYWEKELFTPLYSDSTEAELREVLRRPKFGLTEEEAINLADSYITHCEEVTEGPAPEGTPICRDHTNQMFIDAAYRAQADALVSRDPDIVILQGQSQIPLITTAGLKQLADRARQIGTSPNTAQ